MSSASSDNDEHCTNKVSSDSRAVLANIIKTNIVVLDKSELPQVVERKEKAWIAIKRIHTTYWKGNNCQSTEKVIK